MTSKGRGVEWLDFSFHGEHDFWREFRTSLKGSKLVWIQFTTLPSPPWSRRLFNPWKNRKNKFIFMKNIFQRVYIPFSLLLSSLSFFFLFFLFFPFLSLPNLSIRGNKKRERDWNEREEEEKSREKDRRYFRRRLVPEEQSPCLRPRHRRRPLWRRLITRDRSSLAARARQIFSKFAGSEGGQEKLFSSRGGELVYYSKAKNSGEKFGKRDVTG